MALVNALGALALDATVATVKAAVDAAKSAITAALTDGTQKTQVTNLPATQAVSGTVDVADRSARLLGHVTADALVGGSVAVTNLPATQPVSDGGGSLTVDGTVAVTDGGGSVTVDGSVTADVSDRAARLVGHVTVDNASIPVTGTVALDAPSLAALETINVGNTVAVTGTVALDTASLAALESTTADVSDRSARLLGHVTVDNSSLAVTGTVALDAASLAALESVTVVDGGGSLTVDGSVTADVSDRAARQVGHVSVDNFPATQPVSGSVAVSNFPAAQPVTDNGGTLSIDDGGGSVTVDGTVAVSGTVTVTGSGSAGSPAAGVQTVQGIASGTPQNVQVNDAQTQKVTYLVPAAASTGALVAATEKAVLSLHHLATAGKTVKIRAIDVALVATTATAGNVTARIGFGTAAPTVAGTGVTPTPANRADAPAEVTAQTNPTIIAATTAVQYGFGNLPASGSIAKVRVYEWDNAAEQKPLTLRAGQLESLVLFLTSSAAQTITPYITVYLTEE